MINMLNTWPIAYSVFVGEIIAPDVIFFGWFTWPAAFVDAFNILVATLLVGMSKFSRLQK